MILLFTLLGCKAEMQGDSAAEIGWCEAEVGYRYEPATELTTFPDDWWTSPSESSPTGLRVDMPATDPAFSTFPTAYQNLLDQLSTLDGFGLTPAISLQFNRRIPAVEDLEVAVLAQVDGVWESHPATLTQLDSGRTLMIAPWQPLPPASRVVVALRTDPGAADCVSPPELLRSLLDPASAEPLADRYAEGLDALGWGPEEVGALVVFTTQAATLVDEAVAADIAARDLSIDAPVSCEDHGSWRRCDPTVTVGDYRDPDRVVPDGQIAVQSTYALPLRLWLPPASTPGPYPVVLCGHGLGGGRNQCDVLADQGAALAVAVAAVDAQEHGDHPARTDPEGSDLDTVMALFGFTLVPPSLNAFVMRDNFRASAWDKLQIVRAIEGGIDVDGDGSVDLDPDRIAYAGASLGGIMGPELMAWSPGLRGGALAVPGGGLMNLVLDSDTFGLIATAMTPGDWDEDDLRRSIPMVQTLIDAGDPLVHAAEITRRRASDPQLDTVLLMALDDAIVPNSATAALAQALGVDGVGRELMAVSGISFGAGPLEGNLADGATGGLLEFDLTQPDVGAEWEAADHSYLHESVQCREVMVPFLQAVLDDETPTLTDPYE